MNNVKAMREGVTLIELIISIAIIGIIVVSFLPLFTMSAETNSRSRTTLNSTYIGKDTMELIYSLIQDNEKNKFDDLVSNINEKIGEDSKYKRIKGKDGNIYKYEDNKYVELRFKEEYNLIGVIVEVYADEEMNKLEVKYESLYPWNGSRS